MLIPELLTQRKFVSAACHDIPELLTQRKFVSAECHAFLRPQTAQNCGSYSFDANAHKQPKTVAPTVLMLEK